MGNIELLKATRDQIVRFPETHSQDTWHCETSMCIAGHASVLAGAKLEIRKDPVYLDVFTKLVYKGEEVEASHFADKALGLTESEYDYLFFCMDDVTAIKRLDQVIALWEEGKTLDDIDYSDWIQTPATDCNCGCND